MPDTSEAIQSQPAPPAARPQPGLPAATDPARAIRELTEELERLRAQLRAFDEADERRQHFERVKDERIRELEHELAFITGSRGWRGLCVLKRIRDHYWRRGLRYVRRKMRPSNAPGLPPPAQATDPRPEVRATWNTSGEAYAEWLERFDPPVDRGEAEAVLSGLPLRPIVSIIMPAYNSDPMHLQAAMESVRGQLYPRWELCIADDASRRTEHYELLRRAAASDERVRVRFLDCNQGIAGASNEALAMATGDFVGLLDHDDLLAPQALYEVVKALNRRPETDFFYSDEDKIGPDGERRDPFFKPDWSPTTILSYMYTCHFGVYRRAVVDRVGGFRRGYDGSQDYDLVLRLSEHTNRIHHIPKLLYHWRMTPRSTAQDSGAKTYAEDAARRALDDGMQRRGVWGGSIEAGRLPTTYRTRFPIPPDAEVQIIIPTKDNRAYLQRCIESIVQKTTGVEFHIHVIDNGSTDAPTLAYFEQAGRDSRVRVHCYDRPFNFSAINNWAVRQTRGEYLLLLNDDTEVIQPGWLAAMLEHAARPSVGAVGAKLVYPDGRIQHGGVVLGIGGVAGHAHKYFPGDHHGYFSRLQLVQNLSAVTAACLMTRRNVFEQVGGFNEQELAVAFNDVDLCLRIREAGYEVVYTPYAELYHHESISRGPRMNQAEVAYMQRRWGDALMLDPFYNINLTLRREDFSLCP